MRGAGSSGAPFTGEELSTEAQTPFNRVVKNGKEFRLPLNGFPADRHWRSSNTFDWGAVDLPDTMFADTKTCRAQKPNPARVTGTKSVDSFYVDNKW